MISNVVIVTGGRNYANRAYLEEQLSALRPDCIFHGGANGADALASAWATRQGISQQRFDANWAAYGRAAGPRRNAEMASYAAKLQVNGIRVTVVAFPGGRGTANMVDVATRHGLDVLDLRSAAKAAV